MTQLGDLPEIGELWTAIQAATTSTKPVAGVPPPSLQQIMICLQQLPEPLRQVIQLRYFKHQGIPTIALSLHCSKRAVRNSLDKGLHRLRKEFNPAYRQQLDQIKETSAGLGY